MAKSSFLPLFPLIISLVFLYSIANSADAANSTNFKLARTTLSSGLAEALFTKSIFSKLTRREGLPAESYESLSFCLEALNRSVILLRKSVKEFGHMAHAKGEELLKQKKSFEDRASEAVQYTENCYGKLFESYNWDTTERLSVRGRVNKVTKFTNDAMYYLNEYVATRHSNIVSDGPTSSRPSNIVSDGPTPSRP